MKKLFACIALTIGIGIIISCSHKNESNHQSNRNQKDTIYGTIGSGTSMHELQFCQTHPTDTFFISIVDSTNVADVNLLIGDPIEVIYYKKDNIKIAEKIIGNKTYEEAIGQWTMPDPIDTTNVMGVNIEVCGKASSIRMATLVYKSWKLTNTENMILLNGESIGNGVSFAFTDTAYIDNKNNNYTLKIKDTNIVYTKNNY